MRFTNLFTKTKKDAPKDEVSRNAQLLIRAGFIHKEMAGVYSYLPLGIRVLEKIKDIVRDEMNKIGGQEFIMTSLQPKEIWEVTDRWDDEKVDVWFKSKLKNGTEVGFGWSHEEQITSMMKEYISSYKDLPFSVYQFQTKMRNELRAKSGIMRTREFVMKDLYSYSRNDAEHQKIYDAVTKAYHKVFKRVGIGDVTYFTFASGGAFTQFSHEFQAICDAGEDIVYLDRKKKIAINQEVYTDSVIEQLGLKKDELEEVKAAEVGNIFSFGIDKCETIGLHYTDETGDKRTVVLGSYGIGITRLMGVIVELFADQKGIVWPAAVAPYEVHLIGLNLEDSSVAEKADRTYRVLTQAGVEVIFDDRKDVPAGQKFADADLMGMPYRVVVSAKTGDQMEVKERTANVVRMVNLEEAGTFFLTN